MQLSIESTAMPLTRPFDEGADEPLAVLDDGCGAAVRNRATSRWRAVSTGCTLGLAGIYTAILVWFAHAFSHFWGDDLSTFLLSQTRPFWTFLFIDLGSQFVPLHRLVTLFIHRLDPMSYASALLVLLAFHLAGAFYLHRTLRLFARTRANSVLLAVYLVHPMAGVNLLWFTSGLTRYPYVACSCAAIFHYVRFARTGRFEHLAAVLAAYGVGLGFYSKAIFIPLYLIGIELVARAFGVLKAKATQSTTTRLVAVAVLGATSIAYCVCARRALDPMMGRINADAFSVGRVVVDWILALCGTTAAWDLKYAPGIGRGYAAVLAIALMVLVVRRLPRAAVAVAVLSVLTALNIALIAASSRVLLFGEPSIVFDYRYYYEVWFLAVLFGGMVAQKLLADSKVFHRKMKGRFATVAIPLLLAGYGFESLRGFGFVATERLWYGSMARLYLTNLEADLSRVSSGREATPYIVDGRLPLFLNTLDVSFTHHSHLFQALRWRAAFADETVAELRVAPDGRLVENGVASQQGSRLSVERERPRTPIALPVMHALSEQQPSIQSAARRGE